MARVTNQYIDLKRVLKIACLLLFSPLVAPSWVWLRRCIAPPQNDTQLEQPVQSVELVVAYNARRHVVHKNTNDMREVKPSREYLASIGYFKREPEPVFKPPAQREAPCGSKRCLDQLPKKLLKQLTLPDEDDGILDWGIRFEQQLNVRFLLWSLFVSLSVGSGSLGIIYGYFGRSFGDAFIVSGYIATMAGIALQMWAFALVAPSHSKP